MTETQVKPLLRIKVVLSTGALPVLQVMRHLCRSQSARWQYCNLGNFWRSKPNRSKTSVCGLLCSFDPLRTVASRAQKTSLFFSTPTTETTLYSNPHTAFLSWEIFIQQIPELWIFPKGTSSQMIEETLRSPCGSHIPTQNHVTVVNQTFLHREASHLPQARRVI